jgi:pimeloyl-[acyl-carrier protein] synthase
MRPSLSPAFDEQLLSRAFYQDPYPFYTELRARWPIVYSAALGGWLLTRYDDVLATLQDTRHFSSQGRMLAALERLPDGARQRLKPFEDHFSVGLISSDPPNHTRLRALVNKAFAPRMVERLRPRIQRLVDELLDAVQPRGAMDIVRDLAYPLPAIVIAELLGAPPAARADFKVWSDGILAFQGMGVVTAEVLEHSQRHLLAMRTFLKDLLAERRQRPQDDLLSHLAAAEMEGDRLTEAELLTTSVTLLTAGHETTTNLIANGLHTLLRHPDQLDQLRADPVRLPVALEEVLRYESPLQRNPRRVAADLAYGGVQMRRGEYVLQMLGAANRDPAMFTDADRFVPARHPNRHLAFAFGIHFCVGAPLARLEAPIAIGTVLRRLPGLRLAAETSEWQCHGLLRGPVALPVTF